MSQIDHSTWVDEDMQTLINETSEALKTSDVFP